MSNLKDLFSGVIQKLNDTAIDLTTLDVTTVTGDLTHHINDEGGIDFKNILNEIKTKGGKTEGELKLLAATHIDFDHDTFNFVKEQLTDQEKELLGTHVLMIEQAQKARAAMFSFMQEILN
ncbi:hypothetical protein [Algivirga pacifica]|uniref:DUF2383 domain-containing protein n=1 Tax=Algivirga pacifica TaxID=1162670 RepID=A0ABP9DH87_9BACT